MLFRSALPRLRPLFLWFALGEVCLAFVVPDSLKLKLGRAKRFESKAAKDITARIVGFSSEG